MSSSCTVRTKCLNLFLLGLLCVFLNTPLNLWGQCGATERWAVKVGTDPRAGAVQISQVQPSSVSLLNAQPQLRDQVPANDDLLRLDEETVVYKVSARLILFKSESDSDYHLVISDDSMVYTPGGPGTLGKETGTSFIAEIPDPDCAQGTHGSPEAKSIWDAQLRATRAEFERRFPGGHPANKNLGGIPVTLVGVAFYDRQHAQTGRAKNGIELHPLLSIHFDDEGASPINPPGPPLGQQILMNSSFENGSSGWSGTVSDIGTFEEEPANTGDSVAWLCGTGGSHSESLYQEIVVPPTATAASLKFWLHIETIETTKTQPYDQLKVQIRSAVGKVLKTLGTFSNLDAADGYQEKSYDLSGYIGKTIRIYFKGTEDVAKQTSFVLDDVTLNVK